MNIHFEDKELFSKLKESTLAKVLVGSHLYGTNNEKSDVDYLYIYATSENELLSSIKVHHQLQYKEDGVDYNFVSLHNFISNILSGDSTINYEVVHSNSLDNTLLDWISKYKYTFTTYTMIRSYLGFCRRDIKHFSKVGTDYLKYKRLGHIIRGYIYSRDMIHSDKFDFNISNEEFKNSDIDISTNKMLRDYTLLISDMRNELNELFNNGELNKSKMIDVENGIIFNNEFIKFCKSDIFKDKQIKEFNLDKFIDSYENWVKY